MKMIIRSIVSVNSSVDTQNESASWCWDQYRFDNVLIYPGFCWSYCGAIGAFSTHDRWIGCSKAFGFDN